MTIVLLDTHTLVWNLDRPKRLSAAARDAIAAAHDRLVSPISFYEIGQKVRLGRWAEAGPLLPKMRATFVERGGAIVALGPEVFQAAGLLDWANRDPFDRIIAATALAERAALVSADPAFDGLPGLRRVW